MRSVWGSAASRGETQVTGSAAAMTIVAMALGCAVVLGDLVMLSANLATVQRGLHCSPGTTIFVGRLATVTLAAAVLGAGVLGDRYGMRRMFAVGAVGAIVFRPAGRGGTNAAVLMIARGCIGWPSRSEQSVAGDHQRGISARSTGHGDRALSVGGIRVGTRAAGGGFLAQHIGWRSGFLITPLLAAVALMLTVRYVPETARSNRKVDIPGLLVVAVALIGLVFGISQLQNGLNPMTIASIVGILSAAAFVWWERRTDEPALDLRLFRSRRFSAAVAAGAASNLVRGAAMIMGHLLPRDRPRNTHRDVRAAAGPRHPSLGARCSRGRLGGTAVRCPRRPGGAYGPGRQPAGAPGFQRRHPIAAVACGDGADLRRRRYCADTPGGDHDVKRANRSRWCGVGGESPVAGTLQPRFGTCRIAGCCPVRRQLPADTGRRRRRSSPQCSPNRPRFRGRLDPELISVATSAMIDTAHTLNVIMAAVPIAAMVLAVRLLRREPSHQVPR